MELGGVKIFKKKPKAFELFLGAGAGCNMRCKYCFAGYQDCSKTKAKPIINEELLLQKLSSVNWNDNGRVIIWGGEVLANKEALDVAVKFVRRHWEDVLIHIVTNGAALNPYWVKYLNDNRIMITISHDGVGQRYRGRDLLEDDSYLKLLRQVEGFNSFHFVLHRYNTDAKAIDDYFLRVQDRMGREIGITGAPIRHTNPYTLDFLPRRYDGSLQKVCDSAIYIVSEGLDGRLLNFHSWLIRKLPKYLRAALGKGDHKYPTCGATDILCLGLDGREYLCHAEAERIAGDPDAVSVTKENFRFSQMCLDCEVFSTCAGICAAMPDDETRRLNCDFFKAWHGSLYDYAVEGIKAVGMDKIQELMKGLEGGQDG